MLISDSQLCFKLGAEQRFRSHSAVSTSVAELLSEKVTCVFLQGMLQEPLTWQVERYQPVVPICLDCDPERMFGLHGLWTVLLCGLKCSPICSVCPCSACAEAYV